VNSHAECYCYLIKFRFRPTPCAEHSKGFAGSALAAGSPVKPIRALAGVTSCVVAHTRGVTLGARATLQCAQVIARVAAAGGAARVCGNAGGPVVVLVNAEVIEASSGADGSGKDDTGAAGTAHRAGTAGARGATLLSFR
jgi:hypothetical protein